MTALQKDNHYIYVPGMCDFGADLVGRWPIVYKEAVWRAG